MVAVRRAHLVAVALLIGQQTLSAWTQPQAVPDQPFRLAAVAVDGEARYTEAEVAVLSGLEVGQTITVEQLNRVAARLGGTGLFAAVRYRYRTAASELSVTFEIEEPVWDVPVILDNFVWWTPEDLRQALRARVPSFDGTAPAGGQANDFIATQLEGVLADRGLSGRVEHSSRTHVRTRVRQYLFRVRDADVRLATCHVRFDGVTGALEPELQAIAGDVLGQDYSQAFLSDLAQGTLLDFYRRRGYWAAELEPPVPAILPDQCEGVVVTVHVLEGRSYTWQGVEWIGNAAMSAEALDDLVELKTGDVADVSRIAGSLRAVSKAYRRRGHLLQQVTFTPRLDDETGVATFQMTLDEGPQFRMGVLTVEGVSPREVDRIVRDFDLDAGDVFDATYLDEFLRDEIVRKLGRAAAQTAAQIQTDQDRLVANVRIVVR